MILLSFELFTMLIVIDGGQAKREALKNNHFLQLKKYISFYNRDCCKILHMDKIAWK